MDAGEFFDVLKEKTGSKNDAELARRIDYKPSRISNMRQNGRLSKLVVGRLVDGLLTQNKNTLFGAAIHPVVEFFYADCVESKYGKKFEILNQSDHPELVAELLDTRGVFTFYNSEGEIIYIGRTKDQNLWKEMNDAYNRSRPTYKIFGVNHPRGRWTKNTNEKWRKITNQNWSFYDSCQYFSAYKVEEELISSVEALLIRVAPNDVSNIKMETGKKKKAK